MGCFRYLQGENSIVLSCGEQAKIIGASNPPQEKLEVSNGIIKSNGMLVFEGENDITGNTGTKVGDYFVGREPYVNRSQRQNQAYVQTRYVRNYIKNGYSIILKPRNTKILQSHTYKWYIGTQAGYPTTIPRNSIFFIGMGRSRSQTK